MAYSGEGFDAVVAGGGTAGCASALFLASAGLRVALLEARPLDEAGARWVNGVPPWMFEAAGLGPPRAPERRGRARAFILGGPTGARGNLELRPGPVLSVDVRLLIKRLQVLCRQRGVRLFGRTRAGRLDMAGDRPVALAISGGNKTPARLRAALFVDATGLAGVLRRQVPVLSRSCPQPPAWHLCSAAQEVCAVEDRAGALEFLERNRLEPGAVLARTGVDGGYSTVSVGIDEELDTVDLLAGTVADGRHASGPTLLRELKRRESWMGPRLFGGSGWIPLRRPYDLLVVPGLALVGDAGCQVCPAHGSGTGAGLLAARLLADAVAGRSDPGDHQALWDYACAYQRRLGAVGAAYDVFRRFSQFLSGPDTDRLTASGVLAPDSVRAALLQKLPAPDLPELARQARGVMRAPHPARLLAALSRMGAARALYTRYPRRPDPWQARLWTTCTGRLFCRPPETTG